MQVEGQGVAQTPYLLSRSQENIWNLETIYPGLPINNICTTLNIDGRLDIPLLQNAIAFLVRETPMLRTRIIMQNGKPFQYISEDMPEQAPFFDFSLTGREGVDEWSLSVARESMPLIDSPLYACAVFKRESGTGGVLIKTHHLISDGWSQGLLVNRLAQTYLALLEGRTPEDIASPPYLEHILSEQKYMESAQRESDCAFWREALRDLPGATAKAHEYANVSPIGRRMSFRLPERVNRLVAAFCGREKVSPFAVFYMALAVYLRRIRGQERFCVGVPVINRRTFQEKQTVGMYVSTLPFANSLDESITFAGLNEKLKLDWYKLMRHQRLPYGDIRAIAQENGYTSAKLFDVALSYQNGVLIQDDEARISFEGRWQYSGYQAEALCVHISSRGGDGALLIDYDYLTQLFSATEIELMHRYLMNTLTDGLLHPEKPVRDLRILSGAEEERVLYTFNATAAPVPRGSLKEALRRQAREHASRAAVIFRGERISYEGLHARAMVRAGELSALLGGEERQVVAIQMPRGVALFESMWAVVESGNAWMLLDMEQPEARVRSALERSGVRVLIRPEGMTLLSVGGGFAPAPPNDPAAYLVLTSGSTGEPKAVQVGQCSLLNFATAMRPVYGQAGVLSACSISFDAFLLESMCALLNARTVIIADESQRNDPAALAELMRAYAVGFMAFTPSRLAAYLKEPRFVRAVARAEAIVCGGEAYPEELLRRLLDLTDADLYNQYGPSEATVGVSLLRLNDAPAINLGKPMRNCCLYVLDAGLRPQPVGAAGEIYIGGICLAHGYRGDEALTAERFLSNPFGDGRIYRTGDLGMWNNRGELCFLGRKDQQIKLHGYRIELGEIEGRLLMHPLVTGAAAILYEGKVLAAYYTAKEPLPENELLAFVSAYLPRYMIPATIRQLQELPVTQNGKADYAGLPAPEISTGNAEPEDWLEETILEIWRRVLKNPRLDVNSDYFLSGGDSLSAVEMLLELGKTLPKAPTVAELYANSTVRRLAPLLGGQGVRHKNDAPAHEGIPAAPEMDAYPITPAQERFYVLSAMDETGVVYNMPGAFALSAPVDADRLAAAMNRMAEMDELLRASFHIQGKSVVQAFAKSVSFAAEAIDADDVQSAYAAFIRPFDLSKAPLMRLGVWTARSGAQTLLFDMHHIISDGLSGALLFERLDALYRGQTPAMPSVRYRDYAYWLSERDAAALSKQRAYWQKQMEGAPRETELPRDFAKREAEGRGAKARVKLDKALSDACDALCEARRVTPYAFFAAAFGALLSRLTGKHDLVIGSPVSGRRHPDLQNVTGAFINTLPLRVRMSPEEPFSALLSHVFGESAAMLDNQDLRFEEIVSLAGVAREAGRNPLYNVLFSMVPKMPDTFRLGDAALSLLPLDSGVAKLDLSLEGTKSSEGYAFALEYAAALFRDDTVALWARAFEAVVRAVVADAECPIRDLPGVCPADALRLVERPNRARAPFDHTPVDELLDELARVMPDAPAVLFGEDGCYTYAELADRASGLAKHLLEQGAKPGDRIGLLCARDGDMIAALLGIWKAGCAYVPLETAYPEARMRAMMETAGAVLLVVSGGLDMPKGMPCPVIPARFDGGEGFVRPEKPENALAYLLFTSGSTGDPKGVMVSHRALSNLLPDGARVIGQGERVLCATHIIFDIFVTDVWIPLAEGKTVVVVADEEMLLPWRVARRIVRSRVDTVQLTPSRMQMCLSDADFRAALSGVRSALLIGEPVTEPLLTALRAAGVPRIVNQYGPTEATVFCSWADLAKEETIHIGKPVANCRFYSLDESLRMVPPTAVGELFIAGECLADGYIGREDLTAAAFVPDPYQPGSRMYKTGDMVRLRADGNWDFLGRRDRQIKLNGHRIEIEEITARILRSGFAKEAAVVPVEKDGTVKALRAFLVPAEAYSEQALEAYLAEYLPDYMVPSQTIAVDAFPRTANGKTDLRALAKIEAVRAAAPVIDIPEKKPAVDADQLRAIWAEVLETKTVQEDVSFFKQGGSSMAALMVLSRYYQLGLTLSMNDFYKHPTLREHRSRFAPTEATKEETAQGGEALPARLPRVAIRADKRGETVLTGATGFFGAHVLAELLSRGERVICLIRDEAKLSRALKAYFGREPEGVQTLRCDIAKPLLGFSEAQYGELASRAARVWHTAADVRHYAPWEELYGANVLGTENMLAFCQRAGAWLGHISTASVCGDRLLVPSQSPVFFTEEDLDIGQNWRENAYVRSKALAEARVAEAMRQGLSAQIFRVGRLWARASDGVFQVNAETNALFRTVMGLLELGAAPRSWADAPLEMTPVDQCARAAVLLSETDMAVAHLASPEAVTPASVIEAAGGAAVLQDDAFAALLRARLSRGDSPYLAALAEVFFAGKPQAPQVRLETGETVRRLAAQGFVFTRPEPSVMARCLAQEHRRDMRVR